MSRSFPVLSPKPKLWVEILITVFGAAGVIIFFALYETAFPNASVDVTLSRTQAEEIAVRQLQELGYSVDGYTLALSFSSDSSAAYYLQRTLGIQAYNARLETEQWPVYYWAARWFKPQEKEEFRVYLMPDGEFLGLSHMIKEDAPGAAISQADAQVIAESFLSQYANWKPEEWNQIQASSQTQQGGRVDHTFTWEAESYSAGESELRYTTVVQGDQVGYADSYIKVPESFTRQYAAERNIAWFIDDIAYFIAVYGSLLVAILAILLSRPELRRPVIPALLVAGVSLAAYFNSFPVYKFYYPTTQNYWLFWLNNIGSALLSAGVTGVEVFVLLLGGYCLMKFIWPRQDRILARGPERWIDFSRSAWRGLMIGGIMMAYGVLFYTITKNVLGWWAPLSTGEYGDFYATPLPFIYAVDAGLSAAMIEELSIRLIGIGFFLWLFRGRAKWLAVLVPSLFWAFAHTGYVTSPIYARGLELTVVALFLGLIFLKFDLLTTIMAHFTYNMMLTGIVLLRSNERYYQISGWIVILILILPLLPGLYLTMRRRLQHETPIPEHLTLSHFEPSDLEKLAALPVKADWKVLSTQANRTIACLRAGNDIVGFATGFTDEKRNGYVDGIYVRPGWRRQYRGAVLLDAVQEALTGCGALQVRVLVQPDENRSRAFFHNLFWHSSLQVLVPDGSKALFKEAIQDLLKGLAKEKPGQSELEIPRELL